MLKDSVDFMTKKARFPHITLNVNAIKLIHHFLVNVPTSFDEHYRFKFAFFFSTLDDIYWLKKLTISVKIKITVLEPLVSPTFFIFRRFWDRHL